jgi:leucyl aminopeptidase
MPTPPQIAHSEEPPGRVACDALVVGALSGDDGFTFSEGGVLEEIVGARLSEILADAGFKAKAGEIHIVPTPEGAPARAVAVAGLGPRSEAGSHEVRKAAAAAARKLSERTVLASVLHRALDGDESSAAAEGYLLGSYSFTTYKSDPKPSKIQRILFLDGEPGSIERGVALAEATMTARDLVNEPASTLTPRILAERAKQVADVAGLDCTVLDEDELASRGFGGILGVGRGSAEPPRLIRLHYKPSTPSGKVALVGKGVTFDSGGLSLKPAKSMEDMKTDMAGAAAVIGAMSAMPRLDCKLEVVAFVPSVENMPGGTAVKPGDVLRHYGGRTTEVLNTDAEGRLILGDAIALASEEKPQAIVDVATLTGAVVVALGEKASGLFSNDDTLRAEIERAAEQAGEKVWPLPLYAEYKSELESEIADAKNTSSRSGAAINAALFLQPFVANGIPWAHLDIAGPARAESDYDEVRKGGSGVVTRTLITWIENRGRRQSQ